MSEERDRRIAAFTDGELPADEARAFQAELRRDPALAAEVRRHMRLRERLVAAYSPVLGEPLPPALVATALAANDGGRRAAPRHWLTWTASAASLAVGILIGHAALPQAGPVEARGGRLVARGELARSMETQLASDTGPVRIGLTVRADDGRWCRTFKSPSQRLAGFACREEGRWVAQTLTAFTPQPGAYRTAGVDTAPQILVALQAVAHGDAEDAAAERAARDSGWRASR